MPPKFDPNEIKAVYLLHWCTGGEVRAMSALAPKTGPLGLSPKMAGDDITKATGDWKGPSITVKLTIQNRQAQIKMQAKEPQDKIHQPVSKVIARNRLKMDCGEGPGPDTWYDNAWDDVEQNNKELQEEAGCSYQKLDSTKLKLTGEPEEREESRPRAEEAVSQKEEQVEPEAPTTSRGHGLTMGPRAQARQPPTGDPQVIFRKTHQDRTPVKDVKQPETVNQRVWFEGLPTRVHLPGPRVMCRASALRWVKRCCTRFCSASLEMPMVHRYKV
ncbi:hypothetical protein MG293_011946 [Ovis ammon polii]|uniref:Large ribosomal subunit protein uL11 N-terminal domain-containing protein n=1 Tax=Ovis ammon polii TaxID=230172 RepID=A0AAD4Y8J9_OVIAM|nr:hypothetical protein MG293_011946 [Ovis ammon polii]